MPVKQVLCASASFPTCYKGYVTRVNPLDFVKQELPPAPNMLAQAYQILKAYTPSESGNEMLSFFNCGQDSGASQPHCHFQFVELRPSAPTKPAVPIEVLLDQIERDGKEMGTYECLLPARACAYAPCPLAPLCRIAEPA